MEANLLRCSFQREMKAIGIYVLLSRFPQTDILLEGRQLCFRTFRGAATHGCRYEHGMQAWALHTRRLFLMDSVATANHLSSTLKAPATGTYHYHTHCLDFNPLSYALSHP